MRPLLVLAVPLLSVYSAAPAPAAAWGHSGHKAICETALQLLTANARVVVDRILRAARLNLSRSGARPGPSEACTYPDRITEREMEHHLYYARSATAVDGPGCGLRTPCVNSAIEQDLDRLRSSTLSDRERGIALASLGHWVGDVHQPLHVAFADDLAGNLIDSSGRCISGLHHAWDTCIFETEILRGDTSDRAIAALAGQWTSMVDPAKKVQWQKTPRWQWQAESYDLARQEWLGYCFQSEDGCRYSKAKLTWVRAGPRRVQSVDEDYVRLAKPIIQHRMTQAGIRLAHLINEALDPEYAGRRSGRPEGPPASAPPAPDSTEEPAEPLARNIWKSPRPQRGGARD